MKYEFEVISDIFTIGRNPKLITKNDKIRKMFELDEIEVEEFIDNKTGKHISKYCTIILKDSMYKINRSYEEVKSIIANKSIPITGFAQLSKRYKK